MRTLIKVREGIDGGKLFVMELVPTWSGEEEGMVGS